MIKIILFIFGYLLVLGGNSYYTIQELIKYKVLSDEIYQMHRSTNKVK
jgi:hypothetical protein